MCLDFELFLPLKAQAWSLIQLRLLKLKIIAAALTKKLSGILELLGNFAASFVRVVLISRSF